MHNKSWIADNRIALVGGRNIGDEYYGASEEANFIDLDFAMIGPVVRDASASFDEYWNSPSPIPWSCSIRTASPRRSSRRLAASSRHVSRTRRRVAMPTRCAATTPVSGSSLATGRCSGLIRGASSRTTRAK
jgi:phosphatidylserine/phosphatidylglycerophosphate/cardiolipin synthase-like enzyme